VNILICHNEYAAPSGEEHAISEIASLMCDNGHNVEYFFRSSATIKNKNDRFKAFSAVSVRLKRSTHSKINWPVGGLT